MLLPQEHRKIPEGLAALTGGRDVAPFYALAAVSAPPRLRVIRPPQSGHGRSRGGAYDVAWRQAPNVPAPSGSASGPAGVAVAWGMSPSSLELNEALAKPIAEVGMLDGCSCQSVALHSPCLHSLRAGSAPISPCSRHNHEASPLAKFRIGDSSEPIRKGALTPPDGEVTARKSGEPIKFTGDARILGSVARCVQKGLRPHSQAGSRIGRLVTPDPQNRRW
jgi:hypothetical protein